jgi:putative ABC transport system permease protein
MLYPLWPLLKTFSLQELLHHPWRNVAAVVSVMLGVALAFAVHLINASALDEFSQAVRSVDGKADLELRSSSVNGEFGEAVLETLLQRPEVAIAAPVLELSSYALVQSSDGKPAQRLLLRVMGVDALQMGLLAPDLMPVPGKADGRMTLFSPGAVFLNASASTRLGSNPVQLQQGMVLQTAQVAGSVHAAGSPLAVMDIAAAQDFFSKQGLLSRVDIRLKPGTDKDAWVRTVLATPGWRSDLTLKPPADAAERVGNLSRAYRVNLTVLALIALFTGGFLVFSVLALSVSRRAQQFALLGVLGLTGRQRLQLVVLEAAVLGLLGSALGIGLGTGLAALALQLLGGDLGGGYFSGAAPALQWSTTAACVFAAMGVATALVGSWWPARLAQTLPPAQTLKGLGASAVHRQSVWVGPLLVLSGVVLALLRPVAGVPVAAYVSVGLLLMGGIVALPWLVGVVLDRLAPWVAHRALPLLAVERARRVRESAAVAVSGVVASLSLAVALTVMVSSFRHSVTAWLDTVLPASLYVRSASNSSASDLAYFDPSFVQAASRIAGVERISVQRSLPLNLDASRPAVVLMVRSLQDPVSGAMGLPLVGEALPAPAGQIPVYVSEAMVDLYGAKPGTTFAPLARLFPTFNQPSGAGTPVLFVAGVWRDYARQFGTIAMDKADFARLTEDARVNDIAFWLAADASVETVEQALRDLADSLDPSPAKQAGQLLEFGSAAQIRRVTLTIFDRSFAVTYWLQAVAVGIGLFGVAASFSAQVLARRKEFGLLAHLGLTRRQILRVVAMEGATWTALGALAGVALGLAVAVVLVHVVNPQSFHWTMELNIPWLRLLALALAVVGAGTATAWIAGRSAAGRDTLMAVKEDW